jgi:hypothetical protein
MTEKRSLIFYCDMKLEWARENTQFAVQEMGEVGQHGLRLVFGKDLRKEDVLCVMRMAVPWAQAVGRRSLTAEAWVRAQVNPL